MARATGMWLMAAVGALGVCAVLTAGPITPPNGAIAPSGRTLQEIFDKPSGDGRIAIAGGTSGVTISQPGSYVLTGNITVASGTAVVIGADDVTLDLNGHTVRLTGTIGNGIGSTGTRARLRVHNGRVVGGQSGVNLATMSKVILEDLEVSDVSERGISISGDTSLPNGVVRRCVVTNVGAASPINLAQVAGIRFVNMNGVVEACVVNTVQNNSPPTIGSAVGILQALGTRVVICGNRVSNVATGIGMQNSSGVVARDNIVLGAATGLIGTVTDGGGNLVVP